MTGVQFTQGVDSDFPAGWTIPAGGFALVVKDPAAFRLRWGTGHDSIIAGTFPNDNLRNGGEEIKLSYGAGTEVRRFTYDDAAPWPEAADGSGSTLVLSQPNSLPNHTLPENWRASTFTGGSPGNDDGYTFATWAAMHPGASDPNANGDSDELNNRLEYAFAQNPSSPSPLPVAGGVLDLTVAGVPGRYLTITFTRRTDVLDLSYTPEVSSNLTAWITAPVMVSSTTNSDSTVTEVWRASSPVSNEARLFVRVRIE